ncbi:unnamed protein product, partial [Effrenium voratum]
FCPQHILCPDLIAMACFLAASARLPNTDLRLARATGAGTGAFPRGTSLESRGIVAPALGALAVAVGSSRRRSRRTGPSSALKASAGGSDGLGEWCALYINLARRTDRRERLQKLLATSNAPLAARLERVEAIDKQALTLEDEIVTDAVAYRALERARRAEEEEHYTIVHDEEGNLVHFDDHLTLGGIACALSHRLALQRIAEHPTAEWGLVMEDDVNAVVPRADLAIAKLLSQLPDDWDAVCLGYHDPRGRVHPAAAETEADVEVEVLESQGHVFGLGAWMVRKEAAQELVANAFPIESQVDYTLTNWLARHRRLWKVDPTNLLFYAPSSEEEMDSDVQTMVPIEKIEEDHQSLQAYINYMNGRPSDPYADWDLDLGYGQEDYEFDEEEWLRNWQEQRYEEYYGRMRSEG